jgi:leucyl-tRNA synthetase
MKRILHETIQKVTDDLERRHTFNTAIAAIMELINHLNTFKIETESDYQLKQEVCEAIVLMLSPMVPHITHALWQALGHHDITKATWPKYDPVALIQDTIQMTVQINGKMRAQINVPLNSSDAIIEQSALEHDSVKKHTDGKAIKKVIIVPQKLINIVCV